MSDRSGEQMDAILAGVCAALGLPVDPSWEPQIKVHLAVVVRVADLVMAFSWPDDPGPGSDLRFEP